MIEPTDEMVQLALDKFLDPRTQGAQTVAEIDEAMRETLAAVLALVERDYRLVQRGPQFTNGPIHLIADGHTTTTCCGRPPFELPHGQRITVEPDRATCTGPYGWSDAAAEPHCGKPVGEHMLCARPPGHGFPPCGFPDPGGCGGELAS